VASKQARQQINNGLKLRMVAKPDALQPFDSVGVPAEDRTPDPLIKSQLLYQLSYGNSKTDGKYKFLS
jgi:hypothetical protein